MIETNIYNQEEIHTNCTVQILTNSITGEQSIGWWENRPKNTPEYAHCFADLHRNYMVGAKYRHFKGIIYEVTDLAVDSETNEVMVIYKSCDDCFAVWCRPYEMFTSEVDHEKYPDVKQKMRFERL